MRRARRTEYYNTLRWEYGAADVELGFHYADSPAVVPDGTPDPDRDPTGHEHVQQARPGYVRCTTAGNAGALRTGPP